MKTLEKLLAEYKIRFKETEEIDEATYPFSKSYYCADGEKTSMVMPHTIDTNYGRVFKDGIWATAKITERPEKWVVERNEQHPMWEKFKEWYQKLRPDTKWKFNSSCYGTDKIYNTLLNFTDHQLLTLDQWAELFLDEPKKEMVEFEQAVKPAIEYLFKYHNPHTKIMIDYDTAELLFGEKVVSLNDEIPD